MEQALSLRRPLRPPAPLLLLIAGARRADPLTVTGRIDLHAVGAVTRSNLHGELHMFRVDSFDADRSRRLYPGVAAFNANLLLAGLTAQHGALARSVIVAKGQPLVDLLLSDAMLPDGRLARGHALLHARLQHGLLFGRHPRQDLHRQSGA